MRYTEAIVVFNKEIPNRIVTRCIDYDKHHFVVEAVEDLNTVDYNSPYFGVDKRTGKVTSFIPSLDLDGFFEAIENRTVYSV